MSPEETFDARTNEILQRFDFDRDAFALLRGRLRVGHLAHDTNVVRGRLEPIPVSEMVRLGPPSNPEHMRLRALGEQAIAQGRVGVIILAGGMATRFGGVVKAQVEAIDGLSFLDLKLRDVAVTAERFGGTVPAFLMTSFATDLIMKRLVVGRPRAHTFAQSVSVRVTPDGEVFRDAAGAVSLYAPGHGDLPFALRRTGLLSRFLEEGGEVLLMSNVDNIAATLDPAVIGAHLDGGTAMTVEVVDKFPGDRGGAPALLDGKAQIVEAFRFPSTFDQDAISVFNTNTLLFNAREIDRDFPLTWFAVNKTVDGRPAVQFERLVGELTAYLPARFLHVERVGSHSRFIPVKDPEELATRRDEMRAVATQRNLL